MAHVVNFLISTLKASEASHLSSPVLSNAVPPHRNDPSPQQQRYKSTSSPIIHESFRSTTRPYGISTACSSPPAPSPNTHSLHHPSLVDHPRRSSIVITTVQPKNPDPPSPKAQQGMVPSVLTNYEQLPVRLIHPSMPTIITSSLEIHCTATTLAEDLTVVMV